MEIYFCLRPFYAHIWISLYLSVFILSSIRSLLALPPVGNDAPPVVRQYPSYPLFGYCLADISAYGESEPFAPVPENRASGRVDTAVGNARAEFEAGGTNGTA